MEATATSKSSTNSITSRGSCLRDYGELEGTLLPMASPVEPSAPMEHMLPTATPLLSRDLQSEREEDAPLIPPVPTDEHYRRSDDGRLAMAQYVGSIASTEECTKVQRNNRKVHAYNNQIKMDLERANQVARLENIREHRLQTPPISTPPLEMPSAKDKDEAPSYFTNKRGGYKVKEFDMNEYDTNYSYDVSEYKSVYDE